jgi:hypothetical protein
MSAATTSFGVQLPAVTVVMTSATRNFVDVYADRQPSHSVSSWASSAAWVAVAVTGTCTVSMRSAVAPFGAVATVLRRKRTSAGSGGAVGVGVGLGVARALEVVGAALVGLVGCWAHPLNAMDAASRTAAAAYPSADLVIRTPVWLRRMVGR